MNKGTLIAAVVFGALLVGAVLTVNRKPERGITRLSLQELKKDQLDAFEISGPQNVKLRKEGGSWKLENGRLADASAVDRALDALLRINTTENLTSDPERYAEYEVTAEKGTRVRLYSGSKRVADLVLGKAKGGAAYVRKDEEVFEVPQLSPALFTRPANSWQMLKLFTDALDDVSRVEVALKDQPPYALVKVEGKWKVEDTSVLPEGFRFDENAARSLVSSLVNVSAKEYVAADPGEETTGLSQGDFLAFVGKDGARREMRLGTTTAEKTVYAQVQGSPDVVTLYEYVAKNLRKAATDLRELTLMKAEKDKIQSLAIRSGKMHLTLEKKDGAWKVTKSSEHVPVAYELDPAKADRRVSSFATLRGIRLATAEERGKAGLAKPSATLTGTLEDGSKVVLNFGAETKADNMDAVFARGNADEEIYLVGKWQRDDLLGGLDSLKK